MNHSVHSACRCDQRGIGLIEIVIALLILAIGVLGTAGLQLRGLREVQVSYQRSQASVLAYEIADLMRANRDAAIAGDYLVEPEDENDQPGELCVDAGDTCTPTQIAAADLFTWRSKVADRDYLFSGATRVFCTPDPCEEGSVHRVRVLWDEDHVNADPVPAENTLDTSCPDRSQLTRAQNDTYNQNFLNCFEIGFQL